jgi:hypothetical protein
MIKRIALKATESAAAYVIIALLIIGFEAGALMIAYRDRD